MAQETAFAVEERFAGKRVRLSVSGDVDLATAGALRARIRRLQAQRRDVQLDLSKVEFMDCSGIHAMTDAVTDGSGVGWQLSVEPDLSPQVRRLFALVDLERLLSRPDPVPLRRHA